MNLNTTINAISRFKGIIRSNVSQAKSFKLTHDQLLDLRNRKLFQDPQYKRLPRWAKAELSGYEEALFDGLWALVEWRLFLDGRYVNDKDIPLGRWADVEKNKGQHFWKDSDRPYTLAKERD